MGEEDKLIAFDKCEIGVVKDGQVVSLGDVTDGVFEEDSEPIKASKSSFSCSFDMASSPELEKLLCPDEVMMQIVKRGNKMLDELRSMYSNYISTRYKYNRRERRAFERDFAKKKAALERYVKVNGLQFNK